MEIDNISDSHVRGLCSDFYKFHDILEFRQPKIERKKPQTQVGNGDDTTPDDKNQHQLSSSTGNPGVMKVKEKTINRK